MYLTHFGGLGGAERSLLELMDSVRGLGVEPMLASPSGSLTRAAADANIPVANWQVRRITRSPGPDNWLRSFPRMFASWRALDRIARDFHPHVIHANSAQAMLWKGPVARLRGCPVVWHWRDFYSSRRMFRLLSREARSIIVISESMLTFATDMLGPSARHVVLVRNGVADLPAVDASQGAALRLEMGIPLHAPLVVMAGQSVPRKGHEILLRALADLSRIQHDLRGLLLCPEHYPDASRYTERLRQQAAGLGCDRSVLITGGMEEIAPALRASDIVAVPSLREPFGRIAVEAMLAERPVIASAVDGLNEIVIDGTTGLLVSPGNPALLAEGLARILSDPAGWAAKAKVARQRALQLFSISRAAEEVVAVYGKVARADR